MVIFHGLFKTYIPVLEYTQEKDNVVANYVCCRNQNLFRIDRIFELGLLKSSHEDSS